MSEFEEKVIGFLEVINKKLDKLLGMESSSSNQEEGLSEKEDISTIKPSLVVEKRQEEEKSKVLLPLTEGRRVCPKCEGTAFTTLEDKNEVLHQMGGMKIYKKLYVCKICGTQVN